VRGGTGPRGKPIVSHEGHSNECWGGGNSMQRRADKSWEKGKTAEGAGGLPFCGGMYKGREAGFIRESKMYQQE